MIEYFESRDSVVYGDLVDEFGGYVGYLAVERGPTSEVDEGREVVSVTEADLAIASFIEERLSEAEDVDVKSMLEGGVSGLGAVGSGGMLLRTGDPGWFIGSLLTGFYSKKKFEAVYEDLKERREYRRERSESLDEFGEDYPGIDGYELEMGDVDEAESPVSVVRPETGPEVAEERAELGFQ
ncbi:MAG: hypothetical protein ABEJ87_00790 [Candidatus Nanohalobium sp.]